MNVAFCFFFFFISSLHFPVLVLFFTRFPMCPKLRLLGTACLRNVHNCSQPFFLSSFCLCFALVYMRVNTQSRMRGWGCSLKMNDACVKGSGGFRNVQTWAPVSECIRIHVHTHAHACVSVSLWVRVAIMANMRRNLSSLHFFFFFSYRGCVHVFFIDVLSSLTRTLIST